MRATRIAAGVSVLVLLGAIAWDVADDGFWSRHALFTSLLASLIVVAVTAAVLNEVLERRQRQRWSVLAQYALFELVRTARLVWSGLLELGGLVPDGGSGTRRSRPAPRRCATRPGSPRRWTKCSRAPTAAKQLHRLITGLIGDGQDVLGRWADVMVSSGTYAEIVDRHVELYSRLYWWGSVLDESEPPEEHQSRPKLSRVGPATQTLGPVEDEWLRVNLVAIAQLAELLDRRSFDLAMRIVPLDWWASRLPDRPSTAEKLTT